MRNISTTVTRLMTHALDEICIYSKSPENHNDHIRKVLTTLRKNKLFIKMVKCFQAKRETEHLDFIIVYYYYCWK